MKLANHLVGGFVLTASSASLFFDINIISSISLIGITLVASALPDIDHTQSLMGKVFYPLARWLNRRYGHRTITHGLPLLIILTLFFGIVENIFFGTYKATKVFALGYWFHIFLDMFTISGVKLMYPFNKDQIYVLIGRKDLRIRVDDYKAEAITMFIFIILGIGLLPLMQDGFWTTYNSYFGKPMHLANEHKMSKDLLLVEYDIKKASEQFKGKGYCIEATENLIVLLENEKWRQISNKEYVIEKVIPIHTGKHYRFEATNLVNVSADSLNSIVAAAPVSSINLMANNDFRIFANGVEDFDRKFKADYVNDLIFSEIAERVEVEDFTPDHSHLHRIADIRRQIELIRANNTAKSRTYEAQMQRLADIRLDYEETDDFVEKEQLVKEIKKLEKIRKPTVNESKIVTLQSKIGEIASQANLKNSEKKEAITRKNRAALAEVTDTKFTGIVTQIIITEPELISKTF